MINRPIIWMCVFCSTKQTHMFIERTDHPGIALYGYCEHCLKFENVRNHMNDSNMKFHVREEIEIILPVMQS